MTEQALKRHKALLVVVLVSLIGLAFKGTKLPSTNVQSFDARFPSAYCLDHNCAPCPGGVIQLEPGKRQSVELSNSCWTVVAIPWPHHYEVEPSTYGHTVKIMQTGQTFFVEPHSVGPPIQNAGHQGNATYLAFSGLDHELSMTVQ